MEKTQKPRKPRRLEPGDRQRIATSTGLSLTYIDQVLRKDHPATNDVVEKLAKLARTNRIRFEQYRAEVSKQLIQQPTTGEAA